MHQQNPAAINSRYAAIESDRNIIVYDLSSQDSRSWILSNGFLESGTLQHLALSPLWLDQLAIAKGDQVLLCNVETDYGFSFLPGNGRAITTLEWSCHDRDLLAVGSVDGTICIWHSKKPSQPRLRLSSGDAAPSSIAFCPSQIGILASIHDAHLYLWSFTAPAKPLRRIDTSPRTLTHLTWHPTINGRLLTVEVDSVIRIWDLGKAFAPSSGGAANSDEVDYDHVFGPIELPPPPMSPVAQIRLAEQVVWAEWLGRHGLLVQVSGQLVLHKHGADCDGLTEVWRQSLPEATTLVRATVEAAETWIKYLSDGELQKELLPAAVTDSVGGYALVEAIPSDKVSPYHERPVSRAGNTAAMRPIRLSQLLNTSTGFSKTSRQLQTLRCRPSRAEHEMSPPADTSGHPPPTATPQSLATSAAELSYLGEEDTSSLMPFLSPNIPARKQSPNTVRPIEDSLDLSFLPSSSFDSTPSTVTQESDSDDETIDDGMRGSATLMPGGANVPLPKACGALFAPDGQLITFFPKRSKPTALQGSLLGHNPTIPPTPGGGKEIRLFPNFGNMTAGFPDLDSDGESDISGTVHADEGIEVPPSATPPLASHNGRKYTANTGDTSIEAASQPSIVVSVTQLEYLQPHDVPTFQKYRVLCEDGESGAAVCDYNARLADSAGLTDTANVWRLLGSLIEDTVPLEALERTRNGDTVLGIAHSISSFHRSDSGVNLRSHKSPTDQYGKLRWSEHPLGAQWLVKCVLNWAEQCADVEMLACISSVLAVPFQNLMDQVPSFRPPSHGLDYVVGGTGVLPSLVTSQKVPALRAASSGLLILCKSPIQLQQGSNHSSRNPSQPTTPYLESSSSTPPFTFSSPGSQGRTVPASGSASPELHRSSFGAAARFYAQSITDKFASYGTSPPVKKDWLGTSPRSTNELSSSRTSAGASWPKSVSFASTTESTETSGATLRGGHDDDDGYDSDKTVEDFSSYHASKNGPAEVKCKLMNETAFSDDSSGCTATSLLPSDMHAMAALLCRTHAEQLRVRGVLMEAAEFEKLSGMLTGDHHDDAHVLNDILPSRAPGDRKFATCSVCNTAVIRLEQLCPACLHVSHLDCLHNWTSSLRSEETFECPTGCGCNCADLPFTAAIPAAEHVVMDSNAALAATTMLRRKLSFTDPRRWRAKVDEESW